MVAEDVIGKLTQKYGIKDSELLRSLEVAKAMMSPIERKVVVNGRHFKVTKVAMGPINTEYGFLHQIDFRVDDRWGKYMVLVNAPLQEDAPFLPIFDTSQEVYLRIDSGCEPGQIFYDRACDCREQLKKSIEAVAKASQGILIHIPTQDGRGKGTAFHLATLHLQTELGLDTTEASGLLEGSLSPELLDDRDYLGAAAVLGFLGLEGFKIRLGTNNPLKINSLLESGYRVVPESLIVPPTRHSRRHLKVKKDVLGHRFEGSF